jgi:cobalt-zinc-cadmium efflux system membrane fusion protein
MHRQFRALLTAMAAYLPTALVMAFLAGLYFVGQRYDWKIPKLSSLRGKATKAEEAQEDDTEYDPDAPDLQVPYARRLGPMAAAWAVALASAPSGQGPLLAAVDLTARRSVQLASPELVQTLGLKLEAATEQTLPESVVAHASLDFDQTRYAQLSTLLPGRVWSVEKQVGDPVKKGELLALVDSAEVGRLKAEFLQTLVQVDTRTKTLKRLKAASGATSESQVLEMEGQLREARARLLTNQQALLNLGLSVTVEELAALPEEESWGRLRVLGLPERVLKEHSAATMTANLLPMKAPFDGLVVSRSMVAGEVVTSGQSAMTGPGQPHFVVADVSRLWVMLDVRLEDAGKLVLGKEVRFEPDGVKEESAVGTLTWVSAQVEEKTRTVRARAEVANPAGRLRPHTFGTGTIVVREPTPMTLVPTEAVQVEVPSNPGRHRHAAPSMSPEAAPAEAATNLVFVQIAADAFQPRVVEVGARQGRFTPILAGVKPGEVVVTTGSHVLKSELFKDRISSGD